ncbi:4a-hydroxytetrahydrobiopterin dehydratase [Brachybacterium muris]|uniref:4a-hydroxytetrahydrobiopterin dehydratase n=1 Tax=Brachybacterium muris TaxID=219301 RepID=UPI001EF79FE6|nr:4a-hydroxytetrahydrobiopterin dehydratase [Brachybacterium muris]MBM7500639.1 4a-hydroxytetrahydrobiopterin dehydratase [Brachybacterium muris]
MNTMRGQELLDTLNGKALTDWQGFPDGLRARFLTKDFAGGLTLVNAIGEAAEEANHHPDLTLTYPHLDVKLISHDAGGVTGRDLRMAGRISELAAEAGVKVDSAAPTVLELGLDTANRDVIGPFWAALLTGDASNVDGDDVVDPSNRVPLLWFQGTEQHDVPKQRMHVDLWVGADQGEARIAAAVAAGGTVVDDSQAPSFTVLADADGNRACVCTIADRR